jgi:hypothetical protein
MRLQERLAAAGGRVFFNSGLRVMGILATTRAIGDHDLRPYGVVPTPDVLVLPRALDHEFLVLGSDGLWDVFNNQVGFSAMLVAACCLLRICVGQYGSVMWVLATTAVGLLSGLQDECIPSWDAAM